MLLLSKIKNVSTNDVETQIEKNVNKLQQILFYRSLNFPLQEIKKIMDDPNFSRIDALKQQQQLLLQDQLQLSLHVLQL